MNRLPPTLLLALAAWLAAAPLPLFAGKVVSAMKVEPELRPVTVSHEFNSDISYVGGAKAKMGNTPFGRITELSDSFKYVASIELTQGSLLRLGLNWQRYSFGVPVLAPIPNTLQSLSGVIGADLELTDQWLMRIEAEPGIYSDFNDITFRDFNAPLILGFSYLVNADVQWFFGISANLRRDLPVVPAAGLRWHFDDDWTLMFLLPKPRLEYKALENLTWYLGGEIKGDTYTVASDFGNQFGNQRLNDAELDFMELRLGTGIRWNVYGAAVDLETGFMVAREFDYHRPDVRIVSNGAAPYVQLALRAGF